MSGVYGDILKVAIFGQSHSPAVGATVYGLPAGLEIDLEELGRFMARRAPGRSALTTARREADEPELVSGLYRGRTCGAPVTLLIRNTDARPEDYEPLADIPRPGHADYTAYVKYSGAGDPRGGGVFSGRLTAPLCAAGALCLQYLRTRGVRVFARIRALGGVEDGGELLSPVGDKPFPTVDDGAGARMRERVAEARDRGDSVGGVVECVADGLPAGIGGPLFDGLEGRIASAVFAIPGVKGIEFGAGFALAGMTGSEANDPFALQDGAVATLSNNCGGILGGISDGMPVSFRAVFKPTPSIALPQRSLSLSTLEAAELCVKGRHDPCIVLRAVPCVEAAAAIALLDALLASETGGYDGAF